MLCPLPPSRGDSRTAPAPDMNHMANKKRFTILLLGCTLLCLLLTSSARAINLQFPLIKNPSYHKDARVITDGENQLLINEILVSNTATNLDPDYSAFSDWIEIYNAADQAIDLSGFYLTDDLNDPTKWQIPSDTIIEPEGFLLFWADGQDDTEEGYHTNFQLSASGEDIALFNPDGILIDIVTYPDQIYDISFGRQADGLSDWFFFPQPTPNAPNTTEAYQEAVVTTPPQFSVLGGFYQGQQVVELSVDSSSPTIRYTLDGSTPNHDSAIYTAPLTVNGMPDLTGTVIKARAFEDGKLPSATVVHSYFVDQEFTLPVISITAEPANFWSEEIGIYVNQEIEERKDWERPVHIEFFEPNGRLGFASNVGIRLFGESAIFYPQKSIAIFARSKYGNEEISYPLFANDSVNKFKSFILRSSSDDWYLTMFRDGFAQSLLNEYFVLDIQAYRPAILFLNGKYQGIHNIREKLNEEYMAAHHDVDPTNLDYLRHDKIVAGDGEHFSHLLEYTEQNDLTAPEHYNYVKSLMDVDHYTDFIIAQNFLANVSVWHNIKLWRPRTENGRWQWFIYDLDRTFDQYEWNATEELFEKEVLFQRLMSNETFRNNFLQRFASHMNISFQPERVIGLIDKFKAKIESEMPRHIERWKDECLEYCGIQSMNAWEKEIEVMKEFSHERRAYVEQHLIDQFGLSGTVQLTLDIEGTNKGQVEINGVAVPERHFTGEYFKDIALQLKARAKPGYRFVGWEGLSNQKSTAISITLDQDASLTARFEKAPPIVMSEIHYNPSADGASEFIELYNAGRSTVDLAGYVLSEGIDFIFPPGTTISVGEYIVIAQEAQSYRDQDYQVFEWFSGSLSNDGEAIRLEDTYGNQLDYVAYDDEGQWASPADGEGRSLTLIHPSLDNSLAQNWSSSQVVGGTPGRANLGSLSACNGWLSDHNQQHALQVRINLAKCYFSSMLGLVLHR